MQLFGKVSNIAKTSSLLADVNFIINDPYATSIRYLIADNLTALQDIRVGDGIQSVEANKPVENLPTYPDTYIPNPDEWMANTVVTSNTLLAYETISTVDALPGAVSIIVDTPHPLISPGDVFTYTVSGTTYDAEVDTYTAPDVVTFTVATQPTVTIPSGTFLYFTNPNYGVITFTPSNITRATGAAVYAPYINYIVTSAESTQYFPTRQPDTVTAIATATDYNFLANDVTNVKGTAGLNFYQLQTNPSIGRVSTINPIGVPSIDMIPFLGVYETRPVDSLLALFWETSSTGYISDLNWDVLTGFDGPTRFSDLGFRFFENQDPLGTNTDPSATGDPDCPFITDEFYIENNTGFTIIPLSTPYLLEVKDSSTPNVNYLSSFLLTEESPGLYRIKITPSSNFVFDRGANTNSNFTFVVRVEWGIPGQFANLSFTGRLGNIQPTFLHEYPYYNAFATQTVTTNVTTVTAVNGTHGTLTQKDLYFDILSGNEGNWFAIDYATGRIDLTDATIPLGVYDLNVRVRDAVVPPVPGNPLIGTGVFQTLSETIIVRITIGPKPVDDYLQYFEGGYTWSYAFGYTCPSAVPGQGYGAIHIGVDNLALDPVSHINNALPDITATTPAALSKAFQSYTNVQIANGVAPPPLGAPTGLTKGALEWEVISEGFSSINERRDGDISFILYYRPLMTAPNTNIWQAVLDENGVLFPSSTNWSTGLTNPSTGAIDYGLNISLVKTLPQDSYANRSTKFVTAVAGEYCLVLKHTFGTICPLSTTSNQPFSF